METGDNRNRPSASPERFDVFDMSDINWVDYLLDSVAELSSFQGGWVTWSLSTICNNNNNFPITRWALVENVILHWPLQIFNYSSFDHHGFSQPDFMRIPSVVIDVFPIPLTDCERTEVRREGKLRQDQQRVCIQPIHVNLVIWQFNHFSSNSWTFEKRRIDGHYK